MKTCELQIGITKTIEFDLFRDEIAGAYLVAATTATAMIFNLSVTPEVQITPTLTLVFIAASNGKYQITLAHDFSAWVNGQRIRIDVVMEEGANHYEDSLIIVWKDRL